MKEKTILPNKKESLVLKNDKVKFIIINKIKYTNTNNKD